MRRHFDNARITSTMTRQNLISLFFLGLLLFMLYNTVWILSPFLRPIFWSGVLSFGFYPIYKKILSSLKNESLAAALTTLLIFMTFVPLFTFLIFSIAHESVVLYEWLVNFVRNGDAERFLTTLQSHPTIQKIRESDLFQWEFVHDNIKRWFLGSANSVGSFALKQAALLTKSVFSAVINFLLMLLLMFFFLKDGDRIYQFVRRVTPLDEKNKEMIFTQLSDTLSAVLRGQIFTAIVQAGVAGLVFWLLGLPFPLFFAALTFMTSLIPLIGAATVWVPFVGYLLIHQSYGKALTLFLLGVFVISLVDNFLKPILIGEKVKLPYLLLFLGILGGIQVYGLVGIFIAPMVLSLFFVLIKIYLEKFSDAEDHSRIF